MEDVGRRRSIHTDISLDSRINLLAQRGGDFAVLFYTWAIPHADDDAILRGNEEEIMAKVIPLRRDKTPQDVAAVLTLMHELQLVVWNRANSAVYFPPETFYKYQTYVGLEKRRKSQPDWVSLFCGKSAEEQRETAENSASPSPSPSPSPKAVPNQLDTASKSPQIDLEAKTPNEPPPVEPQTSCLSNRKLRGEHKQKVAGWKGLLGHGLTLGSIENQQIDDALDRFCKGIQQYDPAWCDPFSSLCLDCVQAKFAEFMLRCGKPDNPVAYWCGALARLPTERFAAEHIGAKAKRRTSA